jgi:hypothetical protein
VKCYPANGERLLIPKTGLRTSFLIAIRWNFKAGKVPSLYRQIASEVNTSIKITYIVALMLLAVLAH